jgi:tetratricopeptide (TPR) repeat protein
MHKPVLVWVLAIASATASGAKEKQPDWQALVKAGKCKQARTVCGSWIKANDISRQVEGHKCLANAAFCGAQQIVTLERNDAGGGLMFGGYTREVIDEALVHLNAALKLAPQDLSIHQGRLHVLETSSRYSEMTNALDESCKTYKGPGGADPWIDYTSELFEDKHYQASLALLEVLVKYYPNDHEVLGNLGAVHAALKNDDKAILYLRKALELAPEDFVDTWNLARLYDFTEKLELADQWYRKALGLESDPDKKREQSCAYAGFVEKKLKDSARACELQKASCPLEEQTSCSASRESRND